MRREGRITTAQRDALAAYWDRFGLQTEPLDWGTAFGRHTFPYMEIGFGSGDALLSLAERHPERDYVGVEVYRTGIGRVLRELVSRDITNVRVMNADAVEVLPTCVADASLSGVLVYFPDPWPKKRHQKRRLIRPDFVSLVAKKVRRGGCFELATDWEPYALQMLEIAEAAGCFRNAAGEGQFFKEVPQRPTTRFERRGKALGHGVWDLRFVRI